MELVLIILYKKREHKEKGLLFQFTSYFINGFGCFGNIFNLFACNFYLLTLQLKSGKKQLFKMLNYGWPYLNNDIIKIKNLLMNILKLTFA